MYNGTGLFERCEFVDNLTNHYAGASHLYVEYADLSLVDCSFRDVTVSSPREAICVFRSNFEMTDCTLEDLGHDGVVLSDAYVVRISGSTFLRIGDYSMRVGALSDVVVSDCRFEGGTWSGACGALNAAQANQGVPEGCAWMKAITSLAVSVVA